MLHASGAGPDGLGVRPVGDQGPPLDGIRVVDLASYIAGAYAAMMLADLGAQVVKVESLTGDPFRELPGFHGWNRGKRSVAVDLKAPQGRRVVEELAARGDVVIENMRPGAAERLGLGEARLRAGNPRLVYCSVTGFGASGPYASRPAFDPVLQAMSGVMALQGFGGPPQCLRIPVTDYYAAALAAQAVLAALFVRERTGVAQRVETSLLHASLALQSGSVVDYPDKPTGFRDNPSYRLYQAADGEWLFLACGNQAFWGKLCHALELPELTEDPRFASWLLRIDHCEALLPLLEAKFRSRPRAEWLTVLAAQDIPAAAVQSLADFMRDDLGLKHHDLLHHYEHPEVGPLTLMGQPLVFAATRTRDPGPPPTLGQHTGEVLRELGYEERAIIDLGRRGIVAGHVS